jgi:hypothetical protein
MAVILGAATGAALAQDEGAAPAAEPAQATDVQSAVDTSATTTDELVTTTDAADETTVPDDAVDTDSDSDGEGSADAPAASDLTTTTSDDLNVQYSATKVADTKVPDPNNTCTEWNAKLEGSSGTLTFTDTNGTPVTFTFLSPDGGKTSVWHASAPFTGEILVKSAHDSDNNIGSEVTTYSYTNQLSGTVTSPAQHTIPGGATVRNNISHICVRGTVSTSSESTTTPISIPSTTTASTTTASTTTASTTTASTSTPSSTSVPVGSNAGTTAAATQPAGVAGTTGGGGGGGGKAPAENQGVAAQASTSGGGLPFTGMHAPLLVLMGLALAGAGFVLRRRLKDVS